MFERKILNIYSRITGLFFILSGAGKLMDTSAFGELIKEYGFGRIMVLAPVVSVAELSIGLCLFLLFKPKFFSLLAAILLFLFTLAFAYAYLFKGVTNCGCLGTLSQANIPPLFSFARNAVLLAISLTVWAKYPRGEESAGRWKKYGIVTISCISLFIGAYSYAAPFQSNSSPQGHQFQDKPVKVTPLAKYINTSPGKTYLLFCFSYSCPHCWNSIANLRDFNKRKAVDSILTLATGDDKAKEFFGRNFQPDFYIRDLSAVEMGEITEVYPVAFYIRNDSVKIVLPAELPSPVTFKREYVLSPGINH